MSKLNIGVGEDFPLEDDAIKSNEHEYACRGHWRGRHGHRGHRHWRRHGHPMHGAGAIVILPAAAASVTAAILYPLATLGIIGGLGLAAAAYRHGRWDRFDDERQPPRPDDRPEPPKENNYCAPAITSIAATAWALTWVSAPRRACNSNCRRKRWSACSA